jgi:alpha-glucosidase (family GH31 glycosyl hydrolase)
VVIKSLAYIVSSALVVSASALALAKVKAGTCSISNHVKEDCGSLVGVFDQDSCEAKGCCWAPVQSLGYASAGMPWCFYPAQVATGYTLNDVQETATGLRGNLKLNGAGTSIYGADVIQLSFEVIYENEDVIRIKITDANSVRWEVPENMVKRPHAGGKPASTNIKVTYATSPFSFEVVRVSDGKSLFKLGETFTFKDQYLEIPTVIDSTATTFGLGEATRLNHALQSGHTYTMWAADIGAKSFNKNLYGSYPYYVQMVDGKAHGVMLLNSNGIDASLEQTSMTFKANGGIGDLYVFNGPTPEDVVRQYTGIVGRSTMFPYWTLGFHNCKWGYSSVYQVEEIVANYSKANIPLDTQWMDIDYMQNYRDFTYDVKQFPIPEVQSFVSKLHANGQRFVPIVDPGIMVYPGYDAYDKGLQLDLFIKDI